MDKLPPLLLLPFTRSNNSIMYVRQSSIHPSICRILLQAARQLPDHCFLALAGHGCLLTHFSCAILPNRIWTPALNFFYTIISYRPESLPPVSEDVLLR